MPTPTNFVDRTGQRHGMLVVIKRGPNSAKGRVRWLCICDCGREAVVDGTKIKSGHTSSCGCRQRAVVTQRNLRHGAAARGRETTEHRIWKAMIGRCTNPHSAAFEYYGARGIAVCDRWINSFEAFLVDMGPRPAGRSIDRINNDLGYSPENCRWATVTEQNNNRRPRRWARRPQQESA